MNARATNSDHPHIPMVEVAYRETRWSLVLKACAGSTDALESLSRLYWPVIYSFLRRKGFSQEDAEDMTQETFTRLLGGGRLVDS